VHDVFHLKVVREVIIRSWGERQRVVCLVDEVWLGPDSELEYKHLLGKLGLPSVKVVNRTKEIIQHFLGEIIL